MLNRFAISHDKQICQKSLIWIQKKWCVNSKRLLPKPVENNSWTYKNVQYFETIIWNHYFELFYSLKYSSFYFAISTLTVSCKTIAIFSDVFKNSNYNVNYYQTCLSNEVHNNYINWYYYGINVFRSWSDFRSVINKYDRCRRTFPL